MNIFIDTQDMEERYGEELYKEYLEKQNQQLKSTLEEIKKLVESYNLGKYDYSIPPGGIIDLLQIIDKGVNNE